MNYLVSIDSLRRNFPESFEVPTLLLDFGNWIAKKRTGSLGYFCLTSERFNDFWIENGADLHPYFAFFLRDPTGGQVGYWLYDGPATASPPIVFVGSEGELQIVSGSLDAFLTQLAEGNTKVADLDSRGQTDAEAQELLEWLNARCLAPQVKKLSEHPNLGQWVDGWGRRQRDWINTNPPHLQIADRLRRFVKPNAQPWETANFDVLLVGAQFRMWHRALGPIPMSRNEIGDLEDRFRLVREQRARTFPERGLWLSAWVRVASQGGAILCCNFIDEPAISDEKLVVPTNEYESDFRAFPRSIHWMPEWLKLDGDSQE